MRRLLVLVLLLVVVLAPAEASAQDADQEKVTDIQVRVNGPVQVAAGETAQNVVVISDNATIEGTVTEQLIVLSGNARITGTVEGTVVVVNGHLDLAPGARVGEDVLLYRSSVTQEAGATVGGGIHEEWGGFSFSRQFFWWFWLSMTVAVVLAGLLFAAVGGRQLTGAAGLIGGHAGETVLATLVLWVVLPVLAVLAFVTIIGIPLGFGILFFLMPALWFLGYLIAGTALGGAVLRLARRTADEPAHPYLAVLVGLVIAQVVGLIPFIGGTVIFVAGLVGAGALVYRLWQAWRGTAAPRPVAAPPFRRVLSAGY